MTIIYEVKADELNEKLAMALKEKEEMKTPEWALYVKTGPAKERPPSEKNWWYKRAASILRQLHIKGVLGVNRLRVRYGSKKDMGARRDEFRRASGKIIRTILQQLEKSGLAKKAEGKKKGRELTKQGLEFMNSAADKIKKN